MLSQTAQDGVFLTVLGAAAARGVLHLAAYASPQGQERTTICPLRLADTAPADRGFCEPLRIYHITEPCQFHPVQQRRGTNLAMVEPIGALSGAFADSPWDPWSKGFCSVKSDGPPQNECHALWAPLLRGQHVPWLVATPRQLAAIGKSFLFFKANHPCWGQPSYKLSECDANPIQALIDAAGTYLQEGNPTVVVRRARVERKAFFVFQQSGPKLSGKSSGLRYCEPVLGQP